MDAPSAARGREPGVVWGESPGMRSLALRVRRVAESDCFVLLAGETGTGKGVIAREIHARSRRAGQPFVHVDCGALSPSLIESELFGHERGAFTGAERRRFGRFELAGEGTILLDEIAELAPELQAKLLRVLQDRVFERVGGGRSVVMRARVLAATNLDLPSAVAEGRFRADLLYRLAVVELLLPPLRERAGDIPRLVSAGLERLAERSGGAPPALSEGALAILMRHPWPGNVRELMNVLERLMVCWPDEQVDAVGMREALGAPPARTLSGVGECAPCEQQQARLERVLAACGGNLSRAARQLGIPRSTLRYRLRSARPRRDGVATQLPLPLAGAARELRHGPAKATEGAAGGGRSA